MAQSRIRSASARGSACLLRLAARVGPARAPPQSSGVSSEPVSPGKAADVLQTKAEGDEVHRLNRFTALVIQTDGASAACLRLSPHGSKGRRTSHMLPQSFTRTRRLHAHEASHNRRQFDVSVRHGSFGPRCLVLSRGWRSRRGQSHSRTHRSQTFWVDFGSSRQSESWTRGRICRGSMSSPSA